MHRNAFEDPVRAARYRARFDELWTASLDEHATTTLIRDRLAELENGG
jgi:hypothetical protein